QVLAVLEAADRGVENRIGVAVLPSLVVRGHGQRGLGHRQRAVDEAERVVVRAERADRAADRVVGNRAVRDGGAAAAGGPGDARVCQVLAILETADGGVKSRVGVAVLARLVVR